MSALLDGTEIARVKLDHDFRPVAHFDVFPPGQFTLIEWLETHADWRCQGIGPTVLEALQGHFPDRTLAAYPTEESRTWWEEKVRPTGWSRTDHPEGPDLGWPLYVALRLRHR